MQILVSIAPKSISLFVASGKLTANKDYCLVWQFKGDDAHRSVATRGEGCCSKTKKAQPGGGALFWASLCKALGWLLRGLCGLRGSGFGLAAPASAAAAAHLLAEFFAGFGAEVFEATSHTLLPLAALTGPDAGAPPTPEPTEEDAAQQQQAECLA